MLPILLEQARASRNPVKKLYFWTLHWADTRWALPALFVISFVESSFFPIPPDVLLLAMCFANRKRWLPYAFWCSLASVLGGCFGYLIGYSAFETVGQLIINTYHFEDEFALVGGFYEKNAFLYILAAAFTPIPYKVFTIAAGVFHENVSLLTLVGASILGRSGRFFLVAGIIRIFGTKAKGFLEKHFELASLALFVLGVGGFLAIKYLK